MKLFIIRDISASDVSFVISDELGREKYNAVVKKSKHNVAKGNIKLDIISSGKLVAAKIRQLPIVGVNSYSLKTDKTAATFVVVTRPNGVQCRFYGNNWHFCGNIASKEFNIIDVDNAVIAAQIRHTSGYELEITNPENELICLAAALCVNMINTVDKPALQTV